MLITLHCQSIAKVQVDQCDSLGNCNPQVLNAVDLEPLGSVVTSFPTDQEVPGFYSRP